MLEVKGLSVAYGKHRALESAGLTVKPGEIVVILGANGAGKSTLLKAIAGICEGRVTGSVRLDSEELLGLPSHKVVERGIALVPEGRGIFGDLTVRENLTLGANPRRARDDQQANLDRLMRLFPKLAERRGQVARTMSGGEQQMVAIGRAMMSSPQILMLDEPSLGLSPLLCKELFQNLAEVRKAGLGILLVEQNARQSLAIADRGYLLENGQIDHEAPARELMNDPAVQAAYLGGAGAAQAPDTVAASTRTEAQADSAPPAEPAPRADAFRPRPRPLRTVPASDLAGLDIDALVTRAGQRPHSEPGGGRPMAAAPRAGSADAATSRLRAALSEIERTASNARAQVRVVTRPLSPLRERLSPSHAPRPEAAGPRDADAVGDDRPDSPPVIEVWRAPRIEVWRRRPGSNEFERKQEH